MTSSKLRFADGLSLPFDAVTETFGWVGNRGSGKTYAAKRAAEEMLRVGAQVVVLDPVDAWWGLRYGVEKGSSGLPVYVFGGMRADVPLEPEAGELLADVVVEQGVSVVLSLRGMNRSAQRRFVRDFLDRLYLRKGEEEFRTPLHVFVEEAHTFAPQTIVARDDVAGGCLNAVQDVILQGRSSGLGASLVTQRVAAVAKSVLELVEVMCAFRTTGPNARKALRTWFDAHDDAKERLVDFEQGIASLGTGEAYVWSPGLLDVFGRYSILEAETFDSSSTPKAGEKPKAPKGAPASLDLDELGERIADTRKRAEENDPKILRPEIDRLRALVAEYETRAANAEKVPVVQAAEPVEIPIPFVPEDVKSALAQLRNEIDSYFGDLADRVGHIRNELVRLGNETEAIALAVPPPDTHVSIIPPQPVASIEIPPLPEPTRVEEDPTLGPMSRAEKTLLGVLVQFSPKSISRSKLFVAAGYSSKSSTPDTALATLKKRGYVDGLSGALSATEMGILANGTGRPSLPQPGPDLVAYWRARLSSAEGNLLAVLADLHPGEISFEALCERAGYSTASSTPDTAIAQLRSLGLVVGTRAAGNLRASVDLMGS